MQVFGLSPCWRGDNPLLQKGGSNPPSPTTAGVWERRWGWHLTGAGAGPRVRNPFFLQAGSRWAYRGRIARQRAQRARDTPGEAHPGRLGSRPGLRSSPMWGAWGKPPIFADTPERRGRGGRNPATKAPSGGYLAPQTNTLSVRMQQGLAYLGALVTARRDVGTPAGAERGGNAEVSYA